MSQQQLESLAESIHKYDKYSNNYVLKPPHSLEEHLAQIKRQLFALCFNVEIFVNRPFDKTSKCEMDPEVWGFLHEVVLRLPRTLEVQDIKEARAELYESLYHTERERPPTVTELVNPGADIPEPLLLQKQTQKDDGSVVTEETPIEIHAVPESNGYTPTPFALQQTSVVATDGTEYIVEFIPDDPGEEAEVEGALGVRGEREAGGEAEPAPKAKGKAAATKKTKVKAKAAAAPPKKKTAERKTAAPAKSTKAAAAGRAAARVAAKARAAASAKQRSSSPLSVPDSPTPAAKPKGRRAAVPATSTTQDAAEPAPAPAAAPDSPTPAGKPKGRRTAVPAASTNQDAPAAAPSKGKKRAAEDDEDQPAGTTKKARRGGKTQEATAAAEPGPVRRSVRRKA